MTAFPTGSGNHIPIDNLNQSTDKPKDARDDLFKMAKRVNEIIDSFDANSGICGLTSSGKVDSSKLIGQIDTAQLVGDAVTGDKIEDDAIDSEHINNGAVDYGHISFGSTNTSLGTSNTLVPTQGAVKSYVDSEIVANAFSVGSPQLATHDNVFNQLGTGSLNNWSTTGNAISSNGETVTITGSGTWLIFYQCTCYNDRYNHYSTAKIEINGSDYHTEYLYGNDSGNYHHVQGSLFNVSTGSITIKFKWSNRYNQGSFSTFRNRIEAIKLS